jgi:hypothetical protein
MARILANMLDYDYSERMSLKELAIWVNRQLASDRTATFQDVQTKSRLSLATQS